MKTILTFTLLVGSLMAQPQANTKVHKAWSSPKQETAAKTESVAPNATYSFNTYTAAYQTITGTSATAGKKWDEAVYTIPLGFNFKLYNKQGTSIKIGGGSYVTFDDVNTSTSPSVASPLDEDLCDRAFNPDTDNENDPNGLSTISYTTTGTAPNRVCHIQVDNAGFLAEIDSLNTSTSFVNFQIRLFETSNVIEFHYGNCSIQHQDLNFFAGTDGFACDMYDFTNIILGTGTGNILTGPFATPSMIGFDMNASSNNVISGNIQSGRVYQFINTTSTSTATAVRNSSIAAFNLYPNPAKNKLMIESSDPAVVQNSTFELYDLSGRLVHSDAAGKEIHLPALNHGVYFVKIKSENGVEVFHTKLMVTQ